MVDTLGGGYGGCFDGSFIIFLILILLVFSMKCHVY